MRDTYSAGRLSLGFLESELRRQLSRGRFLEAQSTARKLVALLPEAQRPPEHRRLLLKIAEAQVEAWQLEGAAESLYQAATVGGGTRLGTSRECLALLGCDGDGRDGRGALKLAEITAATLLAGELSMTDQHPLCCEPDRLG